MTEQEILEKINKASNGDWKRKDFIKNCLGYVIDNFDEVEPLIKKHWLDKEIKKMNVGSEDINVLLSRRKELQAEINKLMAEYKAIGNVITELKKTKERDEDDGR